MAGKSPDTLQYLGRNLYILGWKIKRRTNDTSREPPDLTLLARRPLYVMSGIIALSSFFLRQPLLFVGGLLVFMITFVPEIWYRYCLRELVIERAPVTKRAEFGEKVEVRLLAENRKPLPLPWIEIADEFPEALPVQGRRLTISAKSERAVLNNTLALWAYQRVRRRYSLLASVRGAHVFGPARLRISDPFGILTREVDLDVMATLLVHPLVAPLERFNLNPNAPFGERKSRQRLLEDPLRVAGIRTYAPGDEPRRIHWKATARTGALQSKVYEPSTRHTLAIFLDTRTYTHLHMGYDPEIAELAICAAASVSRWALDQGFAVGIFSNGAVYAAGMDDDASTSAPGTLARAMPDAQDDAQRLAIEIARYSGALRLRIPPASRPEQMIRTLDGLARLLPYHGTPMFAVLEGERPRLPMGASVVYIGAEALVDVPLIVALRRCRSHGHSVSLLLTQGSEKVQDDTAGSLHLTGLDTHMIGGREIWRGLVADALGSYTNRRATDPVRADAGGEPVEITSQRDSELVPGSSDHIDGQGDDGNNGAKSTDRSFKETRALVVE